MYSYLFAVLALCLTSPNSILANPTYLTSVKVKSQSDTLPIFAPYSAPVLQFPGGLARLSSPVGPIITAPADPQVTQCLTPCVIDPYEEYVAQVVPVSSQLTYPALPKVVSAYGPPTPKATSRKTEVNEEPKAKEISNGYEYSYTVYDENTGDQKTQHEASDGATVQGQYSLIQPDGFIREVQYTADDISGFNAVVKNFLPKPAADSPQTKAKIEEAPELTEKSGSTDSKKEKETLEPKQNQETPKEETKPTNSEPSNEISTKTSKDNKDEGSRKVYLSFEDIVKCANVLYGPKTNDKQKTDEGKKEVTNENSKSALTYIILPSFGNPC